MSDRITYLTRDGKIKLEEELKLLETEGRAEVAERINQAKELGDISESGEYEDAKKSSGFLEGKIKEIRDILARHQIIEEDTGDVKEVRIGSTVTIVYEGETVVVGDMDKAMSEPLFGDEVRYELLCRKHYIAGDMGPATS